MVSPSKFIAYPTYDKSSSHSKQCLCSRSHELGKAPLPDSFNICKPSTAQHSVDSLFLKHCSGWISTEEGKRHISTVRDQGNTNACFAFAVVDTIVAISGESGLRLSEQEIFDRAPKFFRNCEVSDEGQPNSFENAFGYVVSNGVHFDEHYKWVGKFQENPKIPPPDLERIFIKSYTSIDDGKHDLIVEQLKRQPLAGGCGIPSRFDNWGREDKIYEGVSNGETKSKHAVTLVGYGGVEGWNDYYLCKNSYGERWGHGGYCKVRRQLVISVHYPEGVYKARKKIDEPVTEVNDPMDIDVHKVRKKINVPVTEVNDPMDIDVHKVRKKINVHVTEVNDPMDIDVHKVRKKINVPVTEVNDPMDIDERS